MLAVSAPKAEEEEGAFEGSRGHAVLLASGLASPDLYFNFQGLLAPVTTNKASKAKEAELRSALEMWKIDLPENRELEFFLIKLLREGKAGPANIDRIMELAGKLSEAESDAIAVTMMSVALDSGVGPASIEALRHFQKVEDQARTKHEGRSWVGAMGAGALGLVASYGGTPLAVAGTKMAIDAGTHPVGKMAILLAVAAGVFTFSSQVATRAIDHFKAKGESYGVKD